MSEQLFNNFNTTLATAYTAGDGHITVASASGAPGSGTFTVAILNTAGTALALLFRVTSVAGAVFTGAAEGADGNAVAGSLVKGAILSAAAIAQIQTDAEAAIVAYQTVQNAGTPLVQRSVINFTGSGVSASDSGGITVVNVAGSSAAGASGLASLAASVGPISNTETQVLSTSLAANALKVGTVIRVVISGQSSATTTGQTQSFNLRVGPNNNNTDGIQATFGTGASATGSSIAFRCELIFTVRTTGVSGTGFGHSSFMQHGTTGVSTVNADAGRVNSAQAINTTILNFIQVTSVNASASGSVTVEECFIELVKA